MTINNFRAVFCVLWIHLMICDLIFLWWWFLIICEICDYNKQAHKAKIKCLLLEIENEKNLWKLRIIIFRLLNICVKIDEEKCYVKEDERWIINQTEGLFISKSHNIPLRPPNSPLLHPNIPKLLSAICHHTLPLYIFEMGYLWLLTLIFLLFLSSYECVSVCVVF